jgi:hypothetical protein
MNAAEAAARIWGANWLTSPDETGKRRGSFCMQTIRLQRADYTIFWGVVLLVFGLLMPAFAWRAKAKAPAPGDKQ